MKRVLLFSFIVATAPLIFSQTKESTLLYRLMNSNKHLFEHILSDLPAYGIQIMYTQINRDDGNNPLFETHTFNVSDTAYFYPASTVKLPAALLALEKVNELNIPGLDKYSAMLTDSGYPGQDCVLTDSSSETGLPSIANYIKKILLVSDNDAFNRLFEFLGQEYINERLKEKDFNSTLITHRLSVSKSPEFNKYTNPIKFYNDGDLIFEQPLAYTDKNYRNNLSTAVMGLGYIAGDSLIKAPKDFRSSNYFSISDMHRMLKVIFFPEKFSRQEQFRLNKEDYDFIYQYMSMLPRESRSPNYGDYSHYWDSYVKFFIYGNTKERIPENIRIFNKVGLAYGFIIDNAYIADFKNNVEFLLSAVIYVNKDGIFNDDKYEYEETGFPFLANLGKVIYEYELHRPKKHLPDLSRFLTNYSD